ncbi:hypothetical protein M8J77_010124 [Diaphorina citri]|nr:hypothetical protein M8J77_010124 [Diaphorina citri]
MAPWPSIAGIREAPRGPIPYVASLDPRLCGTPLSTTAQARLISLSDLEYLACGDTPPRKVISLYCRSISTTSS